MKLQSISSLDQLASYKSKLITSKTHTNFYHPNSKSIPSSSIFSSAIPSETRYSHVFDTLNISRDKKQQPAQKHNSQTKLPHQKVSKNAQLNTFQLLQAPQPKHSQSSQLFEHQLKQKMSTYALSTMSSFARTYIPTELKIDLSKKHLNNSKGKPSKRPKLKTNPEQIPNNKTIIVDHFDLFSQKKLIKLSEFRNQIAKTNTIQKTIHQKIMTQGNEEWQKKYLKKRISSFSKISTNINEMNEIFVKKASVGVEGKGKNCSQRDRIQLDQIEKDLIWKKLDEHKESRRNSVQPELNLPQYSARTNFRSTKKLKATKQKPTLATENNSPEKHLQAQQSQQPVSISFFVQKQQPKQDCQQKPSQKLLKLHTQTIYNHFRKHKAKSINTLSSFEDSLIMGKLYEDEQKSLIQDVRKHRVSQKLQKQPKQWQFYNCLNLNKIQLYQTNLNISAESWAALDHLELKFLRGYNIKTAKSYFMIGLRLMIVKCLQRLVQEHNINLQEIKHRIHYKNIKHRLDVTDWQGSKKTQEEEQGFTLRNHTIVSLEALAIGMCRVQHCEDILMCLVYLCGYLKDTLDSNPSHIDSLYAEPIFFKQNTHLHFYISTFISMSMQIAHELNLHSVSIIDTHAKSLKFESHALDVSILFMSCMTYGFFEDICLGKVSSDVTVKYQVGWNHWETRNHYYKNEFNSLATLGFFGFKDLSLTPTTVEKVKTPKIQSLLAYHPVKKTIIVIGGSQINMGASDLIQIDQWIMKTFKRFYKEENKSYKLCKIAHGDCSLDEHKKEPKSKEKHN